VEGRVDDGISMAEVLDTMAEDVSVEKLFTATVELVEDIDDVDVGGDKDENEDRVEPVEETEPVGDTVDD
jgi:hypothetical protein